jgi:hypothetical protein
MLDLDAVVHHHIQAGSARQIGGNLVLDLELHPQAPCPYGDRIARDRTDVFRLAEAVDDVDTLATVCERSGSILQRGEYGLAKDRLTGVLGVHWQDTVAVLLQVGAHFVAGTLRLGRQADDGDGGAFFEDLGNGTHGGRQVVGMAISLAGLLYLA